MRLVRLYSRFQTFSTVAVADRKWSSGAVPGVSNGGYPYWDTLGQSQSIEKTHPPNLEQLWNTTFGLLMPQKWNTVELVWTSLGQSESVE